MNCPIPECDASFSTERERRHHLNHEYVFYRLHLNNGEVRSDETSAERWLQIVRSGYESNNGRYEFDRVVNIATGAPSQGKEVPIVEDELECPLCGDVFEDEESLSEHKADHSPSPTGEDAQDGEPVPENVCDLCGQVCKSERGVRTHKGLSHKDE